MRDVLIPPDRVGDATSRECGDWLLANTVGSVIGREEAGVFLLRFEIDAEAEAFSARWLAT